MPAVNLSVVLVEIVPAVKTGTLEALSAGKVAMLVRAC